MILGQVVNVRVRELLTVAHPLRLVRLVRQILTQMFLVGQFLLRQKFTAIFVDLENFLKMLVSLALFQLHLLHLLLVQMIESIDLLRHVHALVYISIYLLLSTYRHFGGFQEQVIAPSRYIIARNELLLGVSNGIDCFLR